MTSEADPHAAEIDKHHDFFDLSDDDDPARSVAPLSHVWLVARDGANDHRLAPAPPASPLSWFSDGSSLVGAHDGTHTLLRRLRTDGSFAPIDVGNENPAGGGTPLARDDDGFHEDGTLVYPPHYPIRRASR